MDNRRLKNDISDIYKVLLACYGPQHWWPAETPFEVLVGAILTQNTAWKNVERAIANLKDAGALEAHALWDLPVARLAHLLQPAGYYNVKTVRLRNAVRFLLDAGDGDPASLASTDTDTLRGLLLAVSGIGPETADSILLYALQRPVFVVDAYTRRIFGRMGLVDPTADYETIRHHFETRLLRDVLLYNDYHAQIVAHAKSTCRVRPVCNECVVSDLCHDRRMTTA